ncbi:RNA polymerase, sigma 30 subunit, SigH [Desulfonispora thiosulfatigenes DSM 11270]|uniref:RNA polymerase, sigma 30 subunit, SigH n=1 Tax=Desulfonispora thiosulfatigenes DSM 11270 TaxID=656914 RepID=A0A1W1VDI2_DESTI|nr:sigma-70 family RNA polymerase sigma factor [Desulfonispora thiosulfatigenes]SMB91260.1 RNA polymerase, sigma 30 subunit, SigH [Desulfonispora thiosulfatigenes DSM 11270]
MKYSECINLSEEELIYLAKSNNKNAEEILIEKYMKILYWISQNYYAKGADKDDILQIALISFHKSISCYKNIENSLSFKNFAALCVRRELISFLKHTNSLKNEFLNNAIPVYSSAPTFKENDENQCSSYFVNTMLKDSSPNPEEMLIDNELQEYIKEEIDNKLSELEKKVLILKLKGYSYKEISILIDRNEKAIDNSIQRIRKKLKNLWIELKVG